MIVGIDLGTTTSELAYIKNGKPILLREVAHSARGILPSVVGIDSNGRVIVGDVAERLLTGKPEFAAAEVKRRMGKSEGVTLGSEVVTPQEISAHILRYLKEEAEKFLLEPVTEAIITVPAYFNAVQRHATREAGELAGLKVRRLVNEPTAAALAYGLERPGVEEKIVVYDLGGGTFDVTVLELSEGILDVLASTGNSELGGKDFDDRIIAYLNEEIRRTLGIDVDRLPDAARLRLLGRLKATAKKAKEELSSVSSTTVFLENIGITASGSPVDFDHTFTRPTLERLIGDLVESTREQIEEALRAKGIAASEIDTVLLIGGSTRVPLVRRYVGSYFGDAKIRTDLSPDEAVALGAAVLSGIESRAIDSEELVLTDVSAHTLGVSAIMEDEGERNYDAFSPILMKQQTIPRTESRKYSTAHDGQEWVRVRVYEGDSTKCEDNSFVGQFDLQMANPGPAGQPIEIAFSYDLSGEVEVVAKDLMGGNVRRQRFRIAQGLTPTEHSDAQQRVNRLWHERVEPAVNEQRPTPSPSPTGRWKESPLYNSVSALITHAEGRIPSLPPNVVVRVRHHVDTMKAALAESDEAVLRRAERELTDLLFDLD